MMIIILSQYQVTDKFSHLWGVYATWAFFGAEGILTKVFFFNYYAIKVTYNNLSLLKVLL